MQNKLAEKQKEIDALYEEHGLTDEILDMQIELNQKRHEQDIPDRSKIVHENYVQ